MIFSIIILAIVAGIAYFHYAQGFFSATLSAICAVVAAVIAVAYHEPMVTTLLQGKMADYANSICLIALFAIVYLLLRVLLDKAIPGNLRLPVAIDRVGGAGMGVIAGIFAAGVIALAAQAMPFGPSIGGYAKYEVEDREELTLPPNASSRGRQRSGNIYAQLTEHTFSEEKRQSLWIPVDDMLLGFVKMLSDGGSMAGQRTLASVHPDYTGELFAQRLGIQVGASHTALNLPGKTAQVTVPDPGVFRIDADLTKSQIDAELSTLHERPVKLTKGPNDLQLVVRVLFNKDAADKDGYVRLSPGSVRLVGGGRNFYPVGTLEAGKVLYAHMLDDFLLINVKAEDRAADFVFFIDEPELIVSGDAKEQTIKEGVFIEVKRLARIGLGGREVAGRWTAGDAKISVERKPDVAKTQGKAGGTAAGAAPAPSAGQPAAAPLVYSSTLIDKNLFSPVNVGTPDADVRGAQIEGGTVTLQTRQIAQLEIQPVRSLTMMAQGENAISELFEPTGQKIVQVMGTPPPEASDPWAWTTLRDWSLVDAAGRSYSPVGAFARVKAQQTDRMAASFNIAGNPSDIASDEGVPTDVWIVFSIPSGTHLKQFQHKTTVVQEIDQPVP